MGNLEEVLGVILVDKGKVDLASIISFKHVFVAHDLRALEDALTVQVVENTLPFLVGEWLNELCRIEFFKLNSSMVNTIGWNMSNHIPIEQRVVREFTFIDDLGEFDPTLIYTIRGKNYACQKFELTFDSGFQMEPLKKGYFFEI